MDRPVRWEKEIIVRARRYNDGGWRGSIEIPTARGHAILCAEMTPHDARHLTDVVQSAISDTRKVVTAYRPALMQAGITPRDALRAFVQRADTINGWSPDVIGSDAVPVYAADIIGDFGSDFCAG